MNDILSHFKIKINKDLFLSDPSESALGQKIILSSIDIINDLGFEKFTLKKLGAQIGSPEASIYRYFKSKNQLLCYLVSWYWGWMEYRLIIETTNISSAEVRLRKSISLLVSNKEEDLRIEGIDIKKLHQIIISESVKSYLTKDVDQANKNGAFLNYKQLVERVSSIISEINPNYKYPHMLLTTIIEGAHLQIFFAEHLPRLTNKQKSDKYIEDFYINLALQAIEK